MYKVVKALKGNGVNLREMDYDQTDIVFQLEKEGIVYKSIRNGKTLYKLSKNVVISKGDNCFLFEVVPNRQIGLVFDYCDSFECVSGDKEKPEIYCLTCELNPSEETIKEFGLGEKVRVKVLARGYDIANEGLSVRFPRSEECWFKMEKDPFITTGLAKGAKSRNTALLSFDDPITGCFVEGKKAVIINSKAYFSVKDIDVTSSVYSLEEKYGQYVVKKKSEKKIVSR